MKKYILALVTFLAPVAAFAQQVRGSDNISGIIDTLIFYIERISVFFIALAVVYFFYGLFKLFFKSDDEKDRQKAIGYIIGAIVALAIMLSIWGLVRILRNTFNIEEAAPTQGDIERVIPGGAAGGSVR